MRIQSRTGNLSLETITKQTIKYETNFGSMKGKIYKHIDNVAIDINLLCEF